MKPGLWELPTVINLKRLQVAGSDYIGIIDTVAGESDTL